MSEEKAQSVTLETGTYEYDHVSPFKLECVARQERARYIADELKGVEPVPPAYTISHGGGKLPNGQPLPKWEQSYDYTTEKIAELRAEYNELKAQYNEHDRYAEIPVAAEARFVDLHNALDTWDDYWQAMAEIGQAVRYKKRNVGFFLMFGRYMPDSDEWLKEQEAIGIDISEVPDDEQGRFIHWFQTEFVSTVEEYQDLTFIVEGQEGKMQEARRLVRGIFQHPMG